MNYALPKVEMMMPATKVEQIYGIKTKTLANWRSMKVGPPYVKIGSRIYYPIDEFQAWIDKHRVRTAA